MRRTIRLVLLAVTMLALTPGTFVRETPPPPDFVSPVEIGKLRIDRLRTGPLTLESAWVLSSRNDRFGGYSALLAQKGDQFLAASDAGRLMYLPRPDRSARAPELDRFLDNGRIDKRRIDIESLTADPQTGLVWAGLEQFNAIYRFSPELVKQQQVQPKAMKEWSDNTGAEAFVRLADGQFLVLAEESLGDGLHEGLLFARDPMLGGQPLRFRFRGAEGFNTAEATLLPDGRMLVILRKLVLGWPLRFAVRLMTADPAGIEKGEVLESETLADIVEPLPTDNYEGAAVTVEPDGDWAVWLISDDNFAHFQRTLLLKLIWPQP